MNTKLWRALYRDEVPTAQTFTECDFIEHFLPMATFPRILDLACGTGRHSLELARRGYRVTGVDIDAHALAIASETSGQLNVEATFLQLDLRDITSMNESFDGVVLVWQSFGFFEAHELIVVFSAVRNVLRAGGRFILDVYNRQHYERDVVPRNAIDGDILPHGDPWGDRARIVSDQFAYADDARVDSRSGSLFDPHLFSPGQIAGIASNHGLHLIASCSEFTAEIAATSDHPRMQLVFEKM
jgi:SAM-dependent methyltransferase